MALGKKKVCAKGNCCENVYMIMRHQAWTQTAWAFLYKQKNTCTEPWYIEVKVVNTRHYSNFCRWDWERIVENVR